MFQFAGYLSCRPCIHLQMTAHVCCRVPPFGHLRFFASLQLHGAFRSLARPSSVSSGKAFAVRPSLQRKQCSCKPSSVFLLKIRTSVIYLVPKSPLGSSTLPSTAARRQSDEPPSICGIHELTAPRWHSLTITRQLVVSYTTFSPLLSPPQTGQTG